MTLSINNTPTVNVSRLDQDIYSGESAILPPHTRSTLFMLIATATMITGTVGNTLLLVCFCLEKKLRTVSNSLLGHLAAVDLLNCTITIPLYLAMVNTRNTTRSCWLWLTTIPFLTTMSVYIQGLIGINRFFLVTKSMEDFKRCFGKPRTSIYVALGWGFSSVFFGLLTGLMEAPWNDGMHYCNSYSNLNDTRKLLTAILLGFSGLYFAVALFFYIRLALYVKNNVAGITMVKRGHLRTSKILLVLGVFSMLSLLFSPVILLISHTLNIDRNLLIVFDEIGVMVYIASYSINPIFFFTKIQLFKTTLKGMFSRRTRVAPNAHQ